MGNLVVVIVVVVHCFIKGIILHRFLGVVIIFQSIRIDGKKFLSGGFNI